MVVSGLKLRQMNEADRDAVGFVGFAAWRSGEAFDDSYLDPDVIERVRGEFESFAKSPTGDVVVAEMEGVVAGWAHAMRRRITFPISGWTRTGRARGSVKP